MSHTDPMGTGPQGTGHGDGDEHGAWDREINVPFIAYTVGGLVVLTIAAFFLMSAMVGWMEGAQEAASPGPSAMPEANERWIPPGPRLQEFPPTMDIDALHAHEDAQLTSFGWVDEGAGVIRIPVEMAVEVLARRGLEARGQVDALSDELFGGRIPSQPNAAADGASEDGASEDGASAAAAAAEKAGADGEAG